MTEYRAVKASRLLADHKLQTLKALSEKKTAEKVIEWMYRNANSPATVVLLDRLCADQIHKGSGR